MIKPNDDFLSKSLQKKLGNLPEADDAVREDLPKLWLGSESADQGSSSSSGEDVDGVARYIETADGPVWIQGNAVMCSCPDCQAPVSIRTWLMLADCWRCERAIELSYEQQRAVEQLTTSQPASDLPVQTPRQLAPANRPSDTRWEFEEREPPPPRTYLVDILRRAVSMMPAWLISFLFHLALLLLLALILLSPSDYLPTITISTALSEKDREGGVEFSADELDPLEYDSELRPEWRKMLDRKLEDVKLNAEQDARELIVDPDIDMPRPDLETVKDAIVDRTGPVPTLSIRDPRLRNEVVKRAGGTTLSEAAVSRGLRWLASVQNYDGSWSLSNYNNHDDKSNKGDAAGTSLALLPFLGAGQTHEHGKYKDTVTRGLKWLIDHQKKNGDLRYGIEHDAGMYAHGQASIVLVEALSMTGDERFREPAQKAIDFIEAAQHKNGGWRYQPGDSGDTSMMGWQLMALQSARVSNTGLDVDPATLKLADYYLDLAGKPYKSRQYRTVPDGALYRYLPQDGEPKPSMTAEAMLCRMYLGWKRDDLRMMFAVRWLLRNAMPEEGEEMNLYYWYYATQVMHHYGGKEWTIWNEVVRDLLIIEQERGGRYPGSWNPRDFRYGRSGGRIYTTSLAVCTLEVYYRHLPLFRQLDLE